MKFKSSIEFVLKFPCTFKEGLAVAEEELDSQLYSAIVESSFGDYDYGGDIKFSVHDIYSSLSTYVNCSVVITIDAELPVVDDIDEDTFISDYSDAFDGYKQYLVDQINGILSGSDIFGSLPKDTDVIYYNYGEIYAKLPYHSKHLDLEYAPAYVEDEDDVVFQLSDMYYSVFD
jgi:hypothetical protein